MSNASRRNKKPTFYTKQEMRIIGRNDFEKRNADKVIAKSYKDFVVIGYIILHDKFGFGQARIIRLQDFLKFYLDEAASGGNTGKDLSVYLKSKYGIDIKEEVGKIPQRQLMNMYAKKGFCIEREAYRPIAYDVDKVVQQLEKLKSLVPVNRVLDDIVNEKPKELGMLMAYRKAIEIVKGGGVDAKTDF